MKQRRLPQKQKERSGPLWQPKREVEEEGGWGIEKSANSVVKRKNRRNGETIYIESRLFARGTGSYEIYF